MHSILESDGVLSDPYEVLCSMGTLIVEGRTPKVVQDSTASGDGAAKTVKPYSEGPHCPTNLKMYTKDGHKCTENNILCIRHMNLKQHLKYLHCLSPSITIEVSMGPDCLCGELRSQSTLVSTQPSKRDAVLEQWTITMGPKQGQGPSTQMSVLNVYQAVRSLLHFSQVTAWYMSTNGTKPANVIYRVVIPEDATYIADDDFIRHDLPVAEINKAVTMKISLKTLPRKEKIPNVFCIQHSCPPLDASGGSHFEEPSQDKALSHHSPKALHSSLKGDGAEDLLEATLPLKFHGVRKKTNEAQERKRKKHITLYTSPAPLDGCSGIEILDGMPVDVNKLPTQEESAEVANGKRMFPGKLLKSCLGESSKEEFKKSKPSAFPVDVTDLVKPSSFGAFSCNYLEQKVLDPALDAVFGLGGLGDQMKKNSFRTKGKLKSSLNESIGAETKNVMDLLDDRMQISCAISGKHHCKWECDEEADLSNPCGTAEKPKRRRSLSRARAAEGLDESLGLGSSDSDKILHGKFKEVDCFTSEVCLPVPESQVEGSETCDSSAEGCSNSLDATKLTSHSGLFTMLAESRSQTPKIESLPLISEARKDKPVTEVTMSSGVKGAEEKNVVQRSVSSLTEKKPPTDVCRIRKESFESFKKGCAAANSVDTEETSESEDDESEDQLDASNPFLAAILRTTKKSKEGRESKTQKKCDTTVGVKYNGHPQNGVSSKESISAEKFKSYLMYKTKEMKAKVEENRRLLMADINNTRMNPFELRIGRKKPSAVKGPKALYEGIEDTGLPSTTKDTVEDKEDVKEENGSVEDNSPGCSISTKTIPVPSAHDKLKFRRSLDTAAQLVFHRCSGLPLTSSPAPVRRNNSSFSFDSSLNSVSAIKSALFEPANSLSSEDENESEGSLKSPTSPGAWSVASKQINYHSLSPLPLLGSFEESVLNGRLEPVSTVQGFTAELGASGSFCPRHLCLPVTVFFYTLGDNDKVSAPYLGHINLGKKGYCVPRSGTIQVTLFNPLRTVVKMFVVVYDLTDMPPNSHTFLRQRTLYVPASQRESTYTDHKETPFDQEDYHKYLRYLIHLRFVSGKTGRIYLHTDIRMVIFRKADEDTATALGKQVDGETYELRSHTHGPINPKFSPRK
ncbi:hypothetical protein RUM44_006540 [Polyplax serrata]|uniref:Atos-like conserved domain-containing protein n=1 Tax=Polyplax serrata TaxID=468196 RepID=A0ABR1AJ46_POLSC